MSDYNNIVNGRRANTGTEAGFENFMQRHYGVAHERHLDEDFNQSYFNDGRGASQEQQKTNYNTLKQFALKRGGIPVSFEFDDKGRMSYREKQSEVVTKKDGTQEFVEGKKKMIMKIKKKKKKEPPKKKKIIIKKKKKTY